MARTRCSILCNRVRGLRHTPYTWCKSRRRSGSRIRRLFAEPVLFSAFGQMSDTSIRPTQNFQTASIKLLLPIAHKRQLQHAHVHFFAAQQHFSRVAFKGFGHAGDGDGLFQAG